MVKRKFNWLDAVIVAVLVLGIAAAAFFFLKKDNTFVGAAEKTYEVTLRFNRATVDEFDYYQVGDTMYRQNRTEVLGTITDLKAVENYTECYDAATGSYKKLSRGLRGGVEMTVRVQGSIVDGELTVGGAPLLIGTEFYPQSDTTRSVITVWNILEVTA